MDTQDPDDEHTPDADLGPPVSELGDLSVAVDARFGNKVRNKIERRLLAGKLLDLAWTAPLTMLLELLRAPFEWLLGKRRT